MFNDFVVSKPQGENLKLHYLYLVQSFMISNLAEVALFCFWNTHKHVIEQTIF